MDINLTIVLTNESKDTLKKSYERSLYQQLISITVTIMMNNM